MIIELVRVCYLQAEGGSRPQPRQLFSKAARSS